MGTSTTTKHSPSIQALECFAILALVLVLGLLIVIYFQKSDDNMAEMEDMSLSPSPSMHQMNLKEKVQKESEHQINLKNMKETDTGTHQIDRTKNFLPPLPGCSWSKIFTDKSSQSFTKKCMPSFLDEAELRNNFGGINIFMIGNSVTRHYSYSMAAILQRSSNYVPLNRTMEKKSCQGIYGGSSCDHVIKEMDTRIRYLWNNNFGYEVCENLTRDFCTSVSLETMGCIRKVFEGVSSKDILIVGSLATNNKDYCQMNLNLSNPFEGQMLNTLASTSPEFVTQLVKDLLRVFPGRILWTSYPILRLDLDERYNSARTNDLIKKANYVVQSGIEAVPNDRVLYLNLNQYLEEHLDSYVDIIHHTGDKVAQLLLTILG